MNFKKHLFLFAGILSCSFIMAQQPSDILSVSASTKLEKASLAFDKDPKTMWEVNGQDLKADQWLMFTIQTPGDVCELNLQMQGVSKEELKQLMSVFVTYDPMNLGVPVVLTPEYAEKIGADYYARDAKATVDAAKEVYGN